MSKYINLISNILDDYIEDGEVKFIDLNNKVDSFYREDATTKKEKILVKEWDKVANFEGFDTVQEFFTLLKEENCLNVLKYFRYILKMNESLNSHPTTTHVFKLLKEIQKEHPELKSLIIDYKGEMGEFGFDDDFYQNVSKEDLLDDLRDYEVNLDEFYKKKQESIMQNKQVEEMVNIPTKEEIEARNKIGKEKEELTQALLHYATAEASNGIKSLIDCEGCAFYLYEMLGYQKIDKDKQVVVSKEEYNKLNQKLVQTRQETIERDFRTVIKALEEIKGQVKSFYGVDESVGVDISIRTVKQIAKDLVVENLC